MLLCFSFIGRLSCGKGIKLLQDIVLYVKHYFYKLLQDIVEIMFYIQNLIFAVDIVEIMFYIQKGIKLLQDIVETMFYIQN